MKKIAVFLFACLLFASMSFAQAPVEKKKSSNTPVANEKKVEAKKGDSKSDKPAKGQKVMTGVVVNLLSAVTGKAAGINKKDAEGFLNRGEHIGFFSGNKLYLVVNADGTSCERKLAEKAGNNIKITGKVVSKSGLNLIIQSTIE